MALAQIYEGTLEEIIAQYGSELRGQRLRVTTIPKLPIQEQPFYETATPEEWAAELRAWAASHDQMTPLLSEEAMGRESIYEGRGE